MVERHWGEKTSPARKSTQSSSSDKHISVQENKIYYYSNVNRDSAVELNKKIAELESKSLTISNNLEIDPPPIKVLINSGGGSIVAGISSMDTFLRCKVPIHTYVDGFAASAATFLSVVGTHRLMSRNSYMLIHQLSSSFWGTYANFEDEKQNLDLMMKTIKDVYKQYTKVPMKEINTILKHDLLWDAEKCLKYGLVDQII
jgi:ATP-dependent Clp endopeptidase proteolytic subunit ClpP|tara:strand:- start:6254 stop:6856 length:603 start_codon:yes stop_codon:yes gene_type:complete